MPEHTTWFGWILESKTEDKARDEWQVMVARCLKKLGKPPLTVLCGRTAAILLANAVPPSVKLKVATQMHPCQCLMEVGE